MRILLANPRGFCAGVNMAIESLERALDLYGAPVYVYHEIVHNTHVVERFRNRGAVFVGDVNDVPPGSHLMFSAHGVSPEVRRAARARDLQTMDATCPLVNKVHLEAVRFSRAGYTIVLVGHEGHDEVVGTLGEAPERMRLVESVDDVDQLQVPDPDRIVCLTQTTLSADEAARIVERLKQRFPAIVTPSKNDICYATQNRQDAIKVLLPECDLVLVVGSRNSSNSVRLAEIAREHGGRAHLIDSVDDLDVEWFDGDETVLISAGASAPEETVTACVDFLRDRFGAAVEERTLRQETVQFQLPPELRAATQPAQPSFVAG